MLLLDNRIVLYTLISEPVFLIPLLSAIFKIPFDSNIFLIILIFQILSSNALQMGKYVPPEFTAGAVVAFLSYSYSGMTLSYSIIIGFFVSSVFVWIYEAKQKLNYKLVQKFCNSKAILISIIFSFITYFAVLYSLIQIFSIIPKRFLYESELVTVSAVAMPLFSIVKLKSKTEHLYFIYGLVIGALGVIALWAKSEYL